jgi:phage shock protein A
MAALKRKKQYETQHTRLQQQIANVEQMSMNVENAATDIETLKAQQQGAQALKKIFKETGGIDKVEDVLDEVRDAMDTANELGQALAQNVGGGEIIDEDDLENELDLLEMEEADKEILGMEAQLKVPNKPMGGGKVPVKSKKVVDEDDELAALEAELN